MVVVVALVVVLRWLCWGWWRNGCGVGGDSHCKGGRCNSCKGAIVGCMKCCEYFGEGGGDCGGVGGCGLLTLLPLPTSQMPPPNIQ